jgi:hypothetical protein
VKKILLKLLVLLSLGVLGGGVVTARSGTLIPQTVVAADTPPAPERTPSGPGSVWGFWPLYLVTNGITGQPSDVNTVQGTPVQAKLVSTYMPWSIFYTGNEVSSVTARVYRNNQWGDAAVTMSLNKRQPYADVTLNLGTLPVGTYYYQFGVRYSNNSISYSNMIKVTVVPAPKDATAINPQPDRPTIFWGESTAIHANLTPADSTSPVTWTPPATAVGSLSTTTALSTRFSSTVDNQGSIDSLMRNDNGLTVNFPVKATNTVVPGTINGSTQVTVGGLVPQAATANRAFSYLPAALTGIVFPSGATPSYQWSVYNSAHQKITTTAVLNSPTFSWASVTNSEGTTTWRSNYTRLTVTANQSQLIAVPNLSFLNFASGTPTTPKVADFYQTGGVTLNYAPLAGQTSKNTYDGNNTGFLAVQGQNWSLSVSASGFVHDLSGMSLPTNPTLTMAIPGYPNVAVPTNDTAVTLLANQQTNLATNLTSTTSLHVPQTAFMLTGKYQSELTWTLTQAP